MKTLNHLALTSLVTALFVTSSAFAGDSTARTVDNHHGTVTYLSHRAAQKPVSIAFYNSDAGSGLRGAQKGAEKNQVVSRNVTTAHGTVIYYAPAE